MFPPWTEPGRAVVVGVDGTRRNRAAIDWAAEEATASGRLSFWFEITTAPPANQGRRS
jgi:hypothetical protein